MRELKINDIIGYLPHGLRYQSTYYSGEKVIKRYGDYKYIHSIEFNLENDTPILRPLSDLYKTIMHKGKEIIPIVECAKIIEDRQTWFNDYDIAICDDFVFKYNPEIKGFVLYSEYNNHCLEIPLQYKLFDLLNELKIDYRGLINDGLAISMYDLKDFNY